MQPGGMLVKHFSSTERDGEKLTEMVKSIIPPLTYDKHKGQCGRIGVVGGCKEYTGAPYFAAISALKLGADLSHVFCTNDSAVVIKSYSPELIVHPILDSLKAATDFEAWLPRMHALVIGPGLGRDTKLFDNVRTVLEKAKQLGLPMVVDADGVFFLTEEPDVIKNYTKAILTPNAMEFGRLFEKVVGTTAEKANTLESVVRLSQALGNVTIVRKGPEDIISDGINALVCSGEGSPRRCGGQGDLLSGSMGTFAHWAYDSVKQNSNNQELKTYGPNLCSAYAASLLTRECNRRAYLQQRRAATTTDMINHIGESFEHLYSKL